MIDPFHLEAYNQRAVNYNRDVEIFPVLKRILEKITGTDSPYQSPTDMGVNCAGAGIIADKPVQEAAKQEIIRRYFRYACEYAMGLVDKETEQRAELIMKEAQARPEDRAVVLPARQAAEEARLAGAGNEGIYCGAALELADGSIVTGRNSPSMHAASSLILNALKRLAGIPKNLHLLAPSVIASVNMLKKEILNYKTLSLDLDETLISLSISGTTNPVAQTALEKLKELRGCEIHTTHIPTPGDEAGLRRLGVNLTSDPNFSTKGFLEFYQGR